MLKTLQVGIESFTADAAAIYYSGHDVASYNDWTAWKVWERNPDGPSPVPDIHWAGTASSEEPWLGGRLRTWPENAPDVRLPATPADAEPTPKMPH